MVRRRLKAALTLDIFTDLITICLHSHVLHMRLCDNISAASLHPSHLLTISGGNPAPPSLCPSTAIYRLRWGTRGGWRGCDAVLGMQLRPP